MQVEGWLKGEFLAFLTDELAAKRVECFDREVKPGSGLKKVDITLTIQPHSRIWIELKHQLIGLQKGTRYNAQWYMKDKSTGILGDVEKLVRIDTSQRFVLILYTANPNTDDWEIGIREFNNKFGYNLNPITVPTDYPDYYFLGLLHVDTVANSNAG